MLPRHKPICRRPPAPPVNALTTRATALLLLQRTQLADLRDPLAFQSSEHFTVIGAEDLGATLLDTFSEDFDLREQYTEIYDRLLKEHPGITGANAAHNALVEVITASRDRSPPEGFAIHTQMPVGGSVTTFIEPASGVSSTAFNAMESAVKRALRPRRRDDGARRERSRRGVQRPRLPRSRGGALAGRLRQGLQKRGA